MHTTEGKKILKNFVTGICKCRGDWTPGSFIEDTVSALRQDLKNEKVILGLSGGVDSGVAATLLHRAIGKNLYCICVDTGLLRKGEAKQIEQSYRNMGLQIKHVDASVKFYKQLKGITEPEKKRKIIGKTFIEVFDEEASRLSGIKWLAQGNYLSRCNRIGFGERPVSNH
jgi:GMP synthase (glutamine-hydrolysing)